MIPTMIEYSIVMLKFQQSTLPEAETKHNGICKFSCRSIEKRFTPCIWNSIFKHRDERVANQQQQHQRRHLYHSATSQALVASTKKSIPILAHIPTCFPETLNA